MILFLRTEAGNTIVDIEIYNNTEDGYTYTELRSYVNLPLYTTLLLAEKYSRIFNWVWPTHIKNLKNICTDFEELNELRGWLFEQYYMGRKNKGEDKEDIIKQVRGKLEKICLKYKKQKLKIVED